MSERLTYKITFWFLAALLLILPFWSAVIAFVTARTGLSYSQIFWLRVWYEPVLILLFLITVFNPIWEKRKIRIQIVDYLVFFDLLWSIFSIFSSGEGLSQGIQGLRYNGLFLGFYLLARLSFFSEARYHLAEKILTVAGKGVALIAVFEVFLFGPNYWQNWNILPVTSTFGFGAAHKVVSVPQAMATMEGPNQLGSFLLLPLFLLLASDKKRTATDWIWIGIMVLAIVLTFSRSAILGLIVGVLVFVFSEKGWKLSAKIGTILGLLAFGAVSLWFFAMNGGLVKDFFTHGLSNQGHFLTSWTAITEDRTPKELFFGRGIGTAGPASFNFAPNLQESWYLQVFSELGLIGLIAWLGIIVAIIYKYFHEYRGLVLALIGISVAALFLHTWADNPVVAISFFILLGMRMAVINHAGDKTLNSKS